MSPENEPLQLPESTNQSSEMPNVALDIPHGAAEFRILPNDAESFGTVPQVAERKENHTLTVRETARMFEVAGVARTERSIINWCQPNRQGVARLDSYFDPNERKYFITPQSVESAIQEEMQRTNKSIEPSASESFGSTVEHVKHSPARTTIRNTDEQKLQELEREIFDLKITNRAKEIFIERMQKAEISSSKNASFKSDRGTIGNQIVFERRTAEHRHPVRALMQHARNS